MLALILNYKPNKKRIKKLFNLLIQVDSFSEIRILQNETSEAHFTSHANDNIHADMHFLPKVLSRAEKSIYHKHYLALQHASNCLSPSLILEDDVLFNPIMLNNFLESLHLESFDFIYFGTGMHPPKQFFSLDKIGDSYLHKVSGIHKTKCADSILVSPKGAKKFIEYINATGSYLPIDFDMSRVFYYANDFNVYWLEPGITLQGSQKGLYNSTIQKTSKHHISFLLSRLKAMLLITKF